MSTNLASLILVDQLQPATAALLTVANRIGAKVEAGRSLLLFEVQPTGAIEAVADHLQKEIEAEPVIFQLDGRVAYLGVTSPSISDLRAAVESVLAAFDLQLPDTAAEVISNFRVSNLSEAHARITRAVTRNENVAKGQSLLTIECLPAPLAIHALNEAEKETNFIPVDIRFTGSMGRLKIAGSDEEIQLAQSRALAAIEVGA
ncbi:hypothetical protein [Ruegeria sp. Ofav3-42]|uniref:hypothetical protein n=1 Tax=Ruegeria sp. Ofav3-42 TaxID=2917759 RepID=UPI001EF42EC3|nr:hypothetical protein [Ruegeria sp. Ofav3-42]MCG7521948.1 hypothetical protein [Ruegeria sp. Ofav3-42]